MRLLLISDGAVRQLEQPPQTLKSGDLIWVDCVYDEARSWVETVEKLTGVSVFEDHLLDAENRNHPSYFDSTQSYEMIVFRGLAVPPPASSDTVPRWAKTRPTTVFLFPGCVVTVRPDDSRTIPALRERLLSGSQPRQRLPVRPEDLMLRLVNGMVDRYLELRQPMTDQLERWQRLLLDPRPVFHDWLALLEARGELRKLEQLCEEQLDALQGWRDERAEQDENEAELGTLTDAQLVRTSDVVEHINRVLNHARRLQDSVETAVQLHFSLIAHRTNQIMRTLTAITAIFLPLTLITGIFGMNFESMPGVKSPMGFSLTIAAMGVIAIGLIVFFRSRHVLDDPSARRFRRRRRVSQ